MLINTEILKKFRPCDSRWENYLNHYKDFSGSFDEFIDLKEISYQDKIWVARKLLNRYQLVRFGLLCAESVLYIYENKYPNNKAPRELVDFMKTIEDFSKMSEGQLKELEEKKNAAFAAYAAYSVAYAAYAAYAAALDDYAADTYVLDADTYALDAAAHAATYALDARIHQQSQNLTLLKMAASL